MAVWRKNFDWLPISNALAHVQFWQGDLMQAKQYLNYVKTFKRYNLSGYTWTLKKAQQDVINSKKGLARAQLKLRQTLKRIRK